MIDRELLEDMGFRRGEGFDYEIWFKGTFVVRFDPKHHKESQDFSCLYTDSRKDFFKKFFAYTRKMTLLCMP